MLWLLMVLVVGGLVGWLASIVMRTDAQQGIPLNIIVGIVGSFIGNGVLGFLFPGSDTLGSWPPSIGAVLAAFVGAIILLAIVNLVRRGRVR